MLASFSPSPCLWITLKQTARRSGVFYSNLRPPEKACLYLSEDEARGYGRRAERRWEYCNCMLAMPCLSCAEHRESETLCHRQGRWRLGESSTHERFGLLICRLFTVACSGSPDHLVSFLLWVTFTQNSSAQESFNKRGFLSFSVIELNNCSALKWLISSHSCLALAHQRGSRCPSSVPAHSLSMSLTSLLELISLLLSQQGTNFLLSTKDVITFSDASSYVY